jgi:hypothetical protein
MMTMQRKLLLETLRGHLALLEAKRPMAAHSQVCERLRRHLDGADRRRGGRRQRAA